MNQRSTIILVIAVLLALALGYLLGNNQTNIFVTGNGSSTATTTGIPNSTPESTSAANVPISIVTDHDATNALYKLAIEYPQFSSSASDLNAAIKNFVDTNLTSFEQNVVANDAARKATAPAGTVQPTSTAATQIYYFSVSWEPSELTSSTVSIIVRLADFQGGANEDQQIATFNYNLATDSFITLASMFPKDPNYLTTLSKLAQQQLSDSLKSSGGSDYETGQMLIDGTKPVLDNFKNFTFNDDVITIYFPKYQVAPGVFGEQHISLTRAAL